MHNHNNALEGDLLKVLVVDDESLARQRLIKMIERLDGYHCIGEAKNGLEALEELRRLSPDIIMLDVRMPAMDGMEVAQVMANSTEYDDTAIIFTTAYDEYALDAFDVQATGYLLKPINRDKLDKALQKAAKQLHKTESEKPLSDDNKRMHLSTHSRGNIVLIPLSDVRVLQAEHKYVTVFHTMGESILDDSLKMLENEFSELFTRIHRNALVALPYVTALEKNSKGQYQLVIDGVDVRPVVSRRLVTEIRQLLKQL